MPKAVEKQESPPVSLSALLPVVAVALLDGAGQILVQRRPAGGMMAGLWEFPGGKIEPGETPETALGRELREELGIEVARDALVPAVFASEPLGTRHLLLLLYICRKWEGAPQALHAAELRWCRFEDLGRLDMPPADRPLIALLKAVLKGHPVNGIGGCAP
jgi:8-oxo-dGTP diphosphatase